MEKSAPPGVAKKIEKRSLDQKDLELSSNDIPRRRAPPPPMPTSSFFDDFSNFPTTTSQVKFSDQFEKVQSLSLSVSKQHPSPPPRPPRSVTTASPPGIFKQRHGDNGLDSFPTPSAAVLFDDQDQKQKTEEESVDVKSTFLLAYPSSKQQEASMTTVLTTTSIATSKPNSDFQLIKPKDDYCVEYNSAPEQQSPVNANNPIKKPIPPPKRSPSIQTFYIVLWDFDGSINFPQGLKVKRGDQVLVHKLDNDWSDVSLGKLRGLVPTNYLSNGSQNATEVLPSRSSVFKYGKPAGYARDLIGIRSKDLSFGPVTDPVVRFTGKSSERIGERVFVYVDGKRRFELRMGIQGGVVVDAASSNFSNWDLKLLCPESLASESEKSCYHIRYEHVLPVSSNQEYSDDPVRFVECHLFVFNHYDEIIISDVDGTITKSDIGGHLNTTLMQKVGFTPNSYEHAGVAGLFWALKKLPVLVSPRIIYLTARPLNLCVETRQYLRNPKLNLPLGPCITDSTGYYQSARREVIDKSSHIFKSQYLIDDLKKCFEIANQGILKRNIFQVGFGNKSTDALAYQSAGVHPNLIFIIAKKSVTTPSFAAEFTSYEDPGIIPWIRENIYLFKLGKLPTDNIRMFGEVLVHVPNPHSQ